MKNARQKTDWSKSNLIKIVKKSRSRRETLINMGLGPRGGNYNTLKKYLELYKINCEHFESAQEIYNRTLRPRHGTLKEYLRDSPNPQGQSIRRRMILEGLREDKCEVCGQGPIWQGQALTLQIDHIDGNSKNNMLNNLRIICPNCHTQTKTYGAKAR